ncbi:MAG: VWA domain-containing protein [Candidatus Marinimicrobia bacterium]|nr:VWA domain-containing protein [Candidatus Neomarinimicrobiota bacterium]
MHISRFVSLSILLSTISLMGFDKATFDITESDVDSNEQINSLSKIPYLGLDFLEIETAGMEVVLLKEGYFTMGTTIGSDPGILDDNQSLTYGHPFAKTSYPYLIVDGVNSRMDQYFDESDGSFLTEGDSLISLILNNGTLRYSLTIARNSDSQQTGLSFNTSIENLGTITYEISTGFILDPAMGTWGDGALSIDGVPIELTQSWIDGVNFSSLTLDERRNLNTGMNLDINFPAGEEPQTLQAGNWPVLAGYQEHTVNELYDLALEWKSDSISLAPESLMETQFNIMLDEADYPNGPYMHSQLPQMLDIYQGLVYPRDFDCFTSIKNPSAQPSDNMVMTLRGDQLFEEWTSEPFNIGSHGFAYEYVPIQFPEIFEDRVYTLSLELKQGSDILDLIQQNCFIPASPYSDTGMVVIADSVLIHNYPEVSVRFSANEESSGRYLFDLENENVFVYEDQTRIYDFSLIADTTGGNNSADVVFVLDVTGSMGDEIDGVKNNLGAFAQSLDSQGVDYRLAMVTFTDEVENVYDFTSDVDLFQTYIDAQYAHGGGDWKENSLDAIYIATQLQFRDQASREFIWITDAGYHVNTGPTSLTVEDVVDALLLNGVTANAVSGDEIRVEYCEPITVPTGGDWFDINGNFLDILLQISDWGGTNKYLLTFDSPNTEPNSRTIGLEIHYAGLGGYGSISYIPPPATNLGKPSDLVVKCYPNPFNPNINIALDIPASYTAQASIFNIRGQEIRNFKIHASGSHTLQWDATERGGHNVAAGIYLLQVSLLDKYGDMVSQQLIKLIHAK